MARETLDRDEIFEYLRDNLLLSAELIDGHVHSVRVSLKLQYPNLPPGEFCELGSAEIIIPEPEW